MKILGVDPGAKWTGLVLVDTGKDGDDSIVGDPVVVSRKRAKPVLDVGYLREVGAAINDLIDGYPYLIDGIAVEAVTPPNPHVGMTNPGPAMGAAAAAAYAIASATSRNVPVVIIDAAGHGSHDLRTYPKTLVGARETTGRGKGRLHHARSAYDVARTAPLALRIRKTANR